MNSYYERFLATGEVKCIDEEIPFEIPQGWEWARFGSLMINRDSERIPLSIFQRQSLDKIYDYYGASGVIDKVDKYLFDKDLLLIGEDGANLINRSTPIAFIAKGKYWVNNHAHVLDVCGGLNMTYISLFINAISLVDYVTGSAQPKMNQEKMNSILVTVPPTSEQVRIVNQVDTLQSFIERYNKAQNKLDKLNTSVKEQLKKSILQEAIQGKLVPQIAEEGTAQELLEQIQQEKQKLVKESKTKKSALTDSVIYKGDDNKYWEKKDKTEKDITDEIPFEIPDSWAWVRHNDLFDISGGSQPPKSKFIEREKEGYIRLFQIRDYGPNPQPIYIPLSTASKISQKGDILLARYGASLGKVFFAEYGAYNVALAKVIPLYESPLIFPKYIFLYYCSSIYQNEIVNRSRCAQAGFNKEDLNSLLFPLPPLAEQYRIVEMYEKAIASIMSK